MYNAKGWCVHHNTDLWGDTALQDIYPAAAYWPMAGPWMLQHVYDRYLYYGDKSVLEEHWAEFKDATLFLESFLTPFRGWLTTNPSVSPEAEYENGT